MFYWRSFHFLFFYKVSNRLKFFIFQAKELKIRLYRVSAKNDLNIKELFDYVIEKCQKTFCFEDDKISAPQNGRLAPNGACARPFESWTEASIPSDPMNPLRPLRHRTDATKRSFEKCKISWKMFSSFENLMWKQNEFQEFKSFRFILEIWSSEVLLQYSSIVFCLKTFSNKFG